MVTCLCNHTQASHNAVSWLHRPSEAATAPTTSAHCPASRAVASAPTARHAAGGTAAMAVKCTTRVGPMLSPATAAAVRRAWGKGQARMCARVRVNIIYTAFGSHGSNGTHGHTWSHAWSLAPTAPTHDLIEPWQRWRSPPPRQPALQACAAAAAAAGAPAEPRRGGYGGLCGPLLAWRCSPQRPSPHGMALPHSRLGWL